jgi:hypothetical protein
MGQAGSSPVNVLLQRRRLVHGHEQERDVAGVAEAVWCVRRDDDDLIRLEVDHRVAGGPAAIALQQDEGLRVGVQMQPYEAAGRSTDDEDRDAQAGLWPALEERRGRAELQGFQIEDAHGRGSSRLTAEYGKGVAPCSRAAPREVASRRSARRAVSGPLHRQRVGTQMEPNPVDEPVVTLSATAVLRPVLVTSHA